MSTDAEALGRFWADPYGFTPHGGEPLLRFEARVLAAIERVRLHLPADACWSSVTPG